ncbi:DnaJ family domain-containing protein [Bacillus testis]|uniref:DnaJ family domain-containing protein n=1 Tax=Bacillus testis TaxID=1622072 RepID=UPI00067E6A75|nr:DnaJ family domain-containing protein [Bacillus testis]
MDKKTKEMGASIEYRPDGEELDLKNNPGFGKPLPKTFFKGNVYDSFVKIAKDAGYLPPWLEKKKAIHKKLLLLIEHVDQHAAIEKIEEEIASVNKEIISYNALCPVAMQKPPIYFDKIKEQEKSWQ